jgi:ArsR family transcriptional regulator, arsenate/arsenite/antimonite-responsive transcriptional repressor
VAVKTAETQSNSLNLEIAIDEAGRLIHVTSMTIEQAAKQLEALGNVTRLQVYRTLVRAGEVGLPVGQIQERLGIPGSTLSHHLQRLLLTGLVTQERQATSLICRARYPAMNNLIGFLTDECCADADCRTQGENAA